MAYKLLNSNGKQITILIAFVFATAFFLTYRSWNLYPSILDDEYVYSKLSRLASLSDAEYPNYLYFIIYRTTNICGDSFLNCARILNVTFFVSAIPLIYLIGNKVTTKKNALAISVLSILWPYNVYTAYFMPESLYFFAFWAFTWVLFSLKKHSVISSGLFLGTIFGLATLIKPHAIFLLPAIMGMFQILLKQSRHGSINTLKGIAVFIFTAMTIKLLLGFTLAGKSGLTIFGPVYSWNASLLISDSSGYSHIIKLVIENLPGHLLGMIVLFSVPIAQIFLILFSKFPHQITAEEQASINIGLYSVMIFATLIVVVSLFTATASGTGPYETNARLHMRYYNFAFPLLLLVAASRFQLNSSDTFRKWRLLIGVPICITLLYAILTKLAPYTPNIVDSPELLALTRSHLGFYMLGSMSLLSLLIWIIQPRIGTTLFIYVFMPLTVIFSATSTTHGLRLRLVPDAYDRAGTYTKHYLSNEVLSKLVIIGTDKLGLFRTLFAIDNLQASTMVLSSLDFEKTARATESEWQKFLIDSELEWLLLIGDYPLPKNIFFQVPMDGFTLAKFNGRSSIDFRNSSWPGVIARTSGLSPAGTSGTNSLGNTVSIEFMRPLPEKFTMHLWAATPIPIAGKEFVAHVGERSRNFKLGATPYEQVLEFNNPGREKAIKIDSASPGFPTSLAPNEEDRHLGIVFSKIIISAISTTNEIP